MRKRCCLFCLLLLALYFGGRIPFSAAAQEFTIPTVTVPENDPTAVLPAESAQAIPSEEESPSTFSKLLDKWKRWLMDHVQYVQGNPDEYKPMPTFSNLFSKWKSWIQDHEERIRDGIRLWKFFRLVGPFWWE